MFCRLKIRERFQDQADLSLHFLNNFRQVLNAAESPEPPGASRRRKKRQIDVAL